MHTCSHFFVVLSNKVLAINNMRFFFANSNPSNFLPPFLELVILVFIFLENN